MSGFNQLPRDGNIVSISHNGRYIGRIKETKQHLGLANQQGES
jgi:hypothetical protein